MIKNLKIRTKLIVLSFVSLAIALFLGITSIFKLENTNEGLKRVYHDRVLPLVQLKILQKHMQLILLIQQ